MRLALYQPEIPQNTGTLMRLCACLGLSLDIIHSCGFVWDDRKLRRAGMDYMDIASVQHHQSWEEFYTWANTNQYRLALLDAKATMPYSEFQFTQNDILLLGQESSGVPDEIFQLIPNRLLIPMTENCRSLNVALSAAMVVGEGLRQLKI
jgi:tRNA (cytidine/uridine-2'-O-)-methyltransferase